MQHMILNESVQQKLIRHHRENMALFNLAEEYELMEIAEEDDMVMCRFRSDEAWCHFSHSTTTGFLERTLNKTREDAFIVLSNTEVFTWLKGHSGLAWHITCIRLFMDHSVSVKLSPLVGELSPGDLPLVYENSDYQQFLCMDYLYKRLILGGGYCVRINHHPVAWVMTHDDGSVGMLHVLNAHRGKGYARALVMAMASKVQKKGREVFAHIVPDNRPSLKLFTSLGFTPCCEVSWALTANY
jgi:ribosomal protein S18 acetylase RimI-like enzyme